MAISFDGNLELIDLDVQNLVGLTDEQLEVKIAEEMPELSSSEIQTFKDELRTRLAELEDSLNKLQDGYENDLEDCTTPAGQARYQAKLDEVQEALDYLDNIDDAAESLLEREIFLNVAQTDDISFTYGSNELNQLNDGDVVNLTALSGAQTGIFDSENATEAEPVDLNGDGFITYDETIPVPDATTQTAGQEVYLTINSGDALELLSETGNVVTFKLTTSDGKIVMINVTGDANIYFYGTNYMDAEALSGWSEALLKRCHDNGDAMNFNERINADELSETERLGFIAGYSDVTSPTTFNAQWATITGYYADPSAESDAEKATISAETAYNCYADALNKLYGAIDEASLDELPKVWGAIIASWNQAGLSQADQGALIQALVMGVAQGADQLTFQTFFAPVIMTLENILEADEDADGPDKLAMLILESQSGAVGKYAGAAIFSESGGVMQGGLWPDYNETMIALEKYQSFIATTGWILPGEEAAALDRETAYKATVEKETADAAAAGDDGSTVSITAEQKDDLYAEGDHNIDTLFAFYSDECEEAMHKLFTEMLNESPISAETLRTKIKSKVANFTPKDLRDELACLIIWTLYEVVPDLLASLTTDQDWVGGMVNYMRLDDIADCPWADDIQNTIPGW